MKKKQVDVGNATVVPRDDYVQILEAIIAEGFCPFCEEHLPKHHRRPILYTSKHWFVTENAWPYNGSRFHFLFISRTHIEKTEDLTTEMWVDFHKQYRKLMKENEIEGATLMIRSGNTEITGASVTHLHAHLIVGNKRVEHSQAIKAIVGFEK